MSPCLFPRALLGCPANQKDAGIAFLESMNAQIYDNTIDNVKYGIRLSLGSAGNSIYNNEFNDCSDYGLYTYEGSDAPTDGVSNGRPSENLFDSNVISNTAGGVKFKYSDDLTVTSEFDLSWCPRYFTFLCLFLGLREFFPAPGGPIS